LRHKTENIAGARDSQAEQGYLSALEGMTPTERERYFSLSDDPDFNV